MRGKRIVSLLLVGVLCLGLTVESQAATVNEAKKKVEEAQEDIDAAEKEQKKAESDKKEAQAEQKALEKEKEEAEAVRQELADEMNDILAQMEELEEKITAKEAEIDEITEELVQAQIEENDQYEAMKLRIKFMYENGDEQMLQILFESTSMSDFLNKAEYISSVSDYDREQLEEYKKIVQQVKEQQEKLEAEYEELEGLQDELLDQQEKLEELISDKEDEINVLEEDIKDSQDKIDELTQAAKDAARKKEEAEESKKEAEEQQRQAEAAAAAKSGSSTSGSAGSSVSSSKGYFTNPCPGYSRISSGFGPRKAPKAGASTYHKGIDMAASMGTPIYAGESGTVTSASYSGSGGNMIVINHGNGIQTYYMHCSKMYVHAGQKVSRGENIGAVGSTGNSTGPHLHFQVMVNGTAVNPLNYLSL